ncbi:hypothetical protein V7S43_017651 [Phytophthora oleae]|uniref:Bzip transcription factor n=1 Tax=Phytophthora oleae TaxID=2107226 RepID=A0ABD3ESW9_9STRA
MSRYLPAPRLLSDGLVGLVLPRAPAGRLHSDATVIATPYGSEVSPYNVPRASRSPLDSRGPVRDDFRPNGDASDALLSLTGMAGDRPTQLPAGGKTQPMSSAALGKMNTSQDKLRETHKRKRADDSKVRRREQCRANQARYRDKQRNAQMQLEKSVEKLHKELETLKRRYRDLSSRERSNQSPWGIVAEVFRLIEISFRSPWRMVGAQETHTETRQTLAVLETAFAHGAAMGNLQGVEALMEQLRLYSQHFGDPHLRLQRVESMAPGVMTAKAKLSMTVTECTLRHVFPHLKASTGENEHFEKLHERLLGQRLECSSALNFLFDDSDCVERLEISIDMTTPLLRVLGAMKDVSEVLEHARISSECTIGGSSIQ